MPQVLVIFIVMARNSDKTSAAKTAQKPTSKGATRSAARTKPAARKATAKKPTSTKATAKKPAAKKPTAKRTTTKPVARKTAAKKTTARRTATAKPAPAVKKAGVKKAAARKATTPVKKATARKTAAKKTTASKATKATKSAAKTPVKPKTTRAASPGAPATNGRSDGDPREDEQGPVSGVVNAVSDSTDDEGDEDEEPARPAAPEIGAEDLVAHLRSGARLFCEMSDFDAVDTYELHLAEIGPGVRFSYRDGSMVHVVEVGEQAIETAPQLMHISQGTIDSSPDQSPPFLLARTRLSALKNGESVELRVYGTDYTLQLDGTRTATVQVNGEPRSVSVLRAEDEDTGTVVDVLDHATWPVLLRFDDGDDVAIRLNAIDTR